MIRAWLGIGLLLACPFGARADDDDYYYDDTPPNPERHQISGLTFGNGLGIRASGSADSIGIDTTASVGLETRGLHVDPDRWVGLWDFSGRVEGGANLTSASPVAGGGGRVRFGMLFAPGAEGGCDIAAGARANIEGEGRVGVPGSGRFDGGMDATAGMFCVLSDDLTLMTAAELGPHAVADSVGDDLEVRAGGRAILALNDDLFLETAGGRSLFGTGTYGELSVRGRVSDHWLLGADIAASDRSVAATAGSEGERTTNVRTLLTATRGF